MGKRKREQTPLDSGELDFRVQVSAQLALNIADGQLQVQKNQRDLSADIRQLKKEITEIHGFVTKLVTHLLPKEYNQKHTTQDVVDTETEAEESCRRVRQLYLENRERIYKRLRERFPRDQNIECPTLVLVKAANWASWPAMIVLDFSIVPNEVIQRIKEHNLKDIQAICRALPVKWVAGRNPGKPEDEALDPSSYSIINLNDKRNVKSYEMFRDKIKFGKRSTRGRYDLRTAVQLADDIVEDVKSRKLQALAQKDTASQATNQTALDITKPMTS
jgi:hypothetical protein